MLSYTQVTHTQPTLQTHWRTCRKAALRSKNREKIKKLLTTEPHPALIQLKNKRQREGKRRSQWEREDRKAMTWRTKTINTSGSIKEERDSKWKGWHKSRVSTWWILSVVYDLEQTAEALTNNHRQTLKGFGWQERIVMDVFLSCTHQNLRTWDTTHRPRQWCWS